MRGWLVLMGVLISVVVASAQPSATVRLVRVLDGDTLDVAGSDGVTYRLRLIGVNAPETNDIVPCARYWAEQSSAELARQVAGQVIRLVWDVVLQDRYGRWLVYAYVGETLLNHAMVVQGLAAVADSGKNVQQRAVLQAAQGAAKTEKRGMWKWP